MMLPPKILELTSLPSSSKLATKNLVETSLSTSRLRKTTESQRSKISVISSSSASSCPLIPSFPSDFFALAIAAFRASPRIHVLADGVCKSRRRGDKGTAASGTESNEASFSTRASIGGSVSPSSCVRHSGQTKFNSRKSCPRGLCFWSEAFSCASQSLFRLFSRQQVPRPGSGTRQRTFTRSQLAMRNMSFVGRRTRGKREPGTWSSEHFFEVFSQVLSDKDNLQ